MLFYSKEFHKVNRVKLCNLLIDEGSPDRTENVFVDWCGPIFSL